MPGPNAVSRFNTGPIPLAIGAGASVSPVLNIPDGMALIKVTWPNLRNSVKIKFQDCTSATSAARFVRILNGLDSTSTVGVFNGTAASAAGAVFVTDLAGSNFFRIALTASLTSARTFHVTFKS